MADCSSVSLGRETAARETTDLCRHPEGRRTDESVQVHPCAIKLPPSNQDSSPHTADVRKDIASHFSTKKENQRHCGCPLSLVLLRKRG